MRPTISRRSKVFTKKLSPIKPSLITILCSSSSLLVIQVSIPSFEKRFSLGIGKSCVLKRLVENEFKEDHDVTVGVEFGSYLIRVQDKILKLQIWDTAGQESFRSITKIFYRGAHAAILAYSVGMRSSFESLNEWLKEIRNSCSPDVLLFLIGNKSDISPIHREVTYEEALEFQKKNNILYFTETSAKSGDNI